MTSRDFCYWLQGFFELNSLNGAVLITHQQAQMIKQHLSLVFIHEIDPSFPAEQQILLNKTHIGDASGLAGHKQESTPRC